ncbi:MAG: hypothetical protein ACYC6G_15335 [Desulfobaccales bacterium]
MKFCGKKALLALALTLALTAGPAAAVERAEFINGTQWTQWSNQDKLVYIRGIGNWADFVTEAQTQKGKTFEFCISKVLVNELKTQSLGEIAAKVDAYYRENPDKLNTSVIEVILRRCTNACPPEAGAKGKK